MISRLVFTVFVFSFVQTASAFHSVEEGFFVRDPEKQYLTQIRSDSSLTIDHLTREGFEVYGPKGLRTQLVLKGIPFQEFSKRQGFRSNASDYPHFDDYERALKSLHEKYSKMTALFSIGKSGEGRDLWVMKISDHPEMDQAEPEVKYISSMHGDEITGREMLMTFMQEILSRYEHGDREIQQVINNTEIFIMPSMNPDGSMAQTRGNHNGADLNRDFPDFSTSDNVNSSVGRQPETQAVMKFQAKRKFALSANFHGGAEVVNYMWDAICESHPLEHLLISIATDYAAKVPYMKSSQEFPDGTTNGCAWYVVNGGMQDWSYYWYGDTQFTIELSDEKWPPYSEMTSFYKDNEASLVQFLKAVHQGAGFKFSTQDVSGSVTIKKKETNNVRDLGSFAFSKSEFFKVLDPGDYVFAVHSEGGPSRDFEINVAANRIYPKGNYKRLNVSLLQKE